ncbi:MAG: protein phosphatase 2C domain-containing protein [Gammaproteobacteria bacterium]|nr:protein phosphatase 2C domain-containing protein [Gammaproteobacteria bacterium]
MNVVAVGVTDVGKIRDENEDEFLIRDDLDLFTVADGVGGAAAGEVASHIFIKTCEVLFSRQTGWNNSRLQLVQKCFSEANTHIKNYGINNPKAAGMGCTADVLTFEDGKYIIGHVGDSRTYLYRNGKLTQITRDHSVNQERIDLGLVSKDIQPLANNAIYLAVGHMKDTPASIYSDSYQSGDIFLLCSDGLSDMLIESHIEDIMGRFDDLPHKLSLLINEANRKGGKDNITAILVEVI